MLFEVISHFMALDFSWFIALILNNILWVFVFACLGRFIYGMNPLHGAVFIAVYFYSLSDFTGLLGWVYRKGFFWTISLGFIAMVCFDAFFKGNDAMKKKRGFTASALFYAFLFAINIFM